MAPGSIPRYLSVIKIFCRFLDSQGIILFNADRDVLRSFIEYLRLDRGVSQKTLENYFTMLSSLYEYFTYERYVENNLILPVRSDILGVTRRTMKVR